MGKFSNHKGFTLLELMVVLGIIVILSAVSFPLLSDMIENSNYKSSARLISSTLRDSRALAISRNLEHRVLVNPSSAQLRVQRGSRASNTPDDEWTDVSVRSLSAGVLLRADSGCDSTLTKSIAFTPKGTGTQQVFCLLDPDGSLTLDQRKKYRIGVTGPTTGRVTIASWNRSGSHWN